MMMLSARLRNVAISGVALLGLFVVFWHAQEIDVEEHSRFRDEIQQLKQWDMALNQDVLKVRSRLLSHYDSIAAAAAQLEQLQDRLRQLPNFLDQEAHKELVQLLNVYAVALKQKEQAIERFQAQHAQLKDSLENLPLLITKTSSELTHDLPLSATLHDLLREVLLYAFASKDDLTVRIQARLAALDKRSSKPTDKTPGMHSVISHVSTIVNAKPQVDVLLNELLAFPTLAYAEEFSTTYNRHYEDTRKMADYYRLGLFACAVFVVGYLAWVIIQRLGASSEAVQKSEERMALAMQGSQDGLWERDLETNEIYVSSRFKSLLGYNEQNEQAAEQAAEQAEQRDEEYEISFEAKDFEELLHPEDRTDAMQAMAGSIRDITERKWAEEKLRAGAEVLAASIDQIMTSLAQLAASESATASAVTQTATTVEQFKQAAHLSDQKARDVSANARQTMQISQHGMQAVEKAMAGMTLVREQTREIAKSVVQLGKKGETIGAIIETVTDLADQSNLLAINAAMQAAKAGEQGKGFAVVAEEVKNLSDQSEQAAEQVQGILTEIRQASSLAVRVTDQGTESAEAGVQRSAEAGESIRVLSQSIGEAAEATQQIAASNREQVVGVDQVTLAIESVRKASLQSLTGTEQIETAIQDLHGVGQTLTQLIEQYALHNSVRQTRADTSL
jgi:methyl-accepting chemotaxis protein